MTTPVESFAQEEIEDRAKLCVSPANLEGKNVHSSRYTEQFVIRFPDGMRDRIAQLAKRNGRSMNAEIVFLITSGLYHTSSTAENSDRVERIARVLASLPEQKLKALSIALGIDLID